MLLLPGLTHADAIGGFFFDFGIASFFFYLEVQAEGAVDMGVGEMGVGDSQEPGRGCWDVFCDRRDRRSGAFVRAGCRVVCGLFSVCMTGACGVFRPVVVGEYFDEYFERCEALVLPFVWGFVFEGGSARLF